MKIAFLLAALLAGAGNAHAQTKAHMHAKEYATFGGGCFWCLEAVYESLPGVVSVEPGYAGGTVPDPTYDAVCTGATGHAEVTRIGFDPSKVRYEDLLALFWKAHDPTTLNRQGADVGTQYRSIILYENEKQRAAAEASKTEAQKHIDGRIVTEIVPLRAFYPAEDYHRQYYRNHKDAPYCRFVIKPKLDKLGIH